MNYWETVYKVAFGLIVALLLVAVVCLFLPKCRLLSELQKKKLAYQQQNRQIETSTEELRLKEERFNSDPEFVERTARGIGMVKTNEIMLKVTNE